MTRSTSLTGGAPAPPGRVRGYVRRPWLGFPPGRFARREELRRLDPQAHCHLIYRDIALREFPWDINISVTLALYRDFTVPDIAAVLTHTGKMERNAGKRMNDTAHLLFEILNYGFHHPRGISAIRRINRIHRQVMLSVDDPGRTSLMSNDNFIYVLGTFFVPSIRWIDKYGWRSLTENERAAIFFFYRELGLRLGVKGIPGTCAEFIRWFDAYERRRVRYSAPSRRLWDATQALLAAMMADSLPWPFLRDDGSLGRKVADWATGALLDDAIREALGAPRPPVPVGWAIRAALHCRRRTVRLMRPREAAVIPRGILVESSDGQGIPPRL